MSDDPARDRPDEEAAIELPQSLEKQLASLPADKRETIRRAFVSYTEVSSGPFPPPRMLDGYERYHPGFLKELMDRSLDAQRHEQELDKLRVELPFKYASKGQTLGAIIVIAAIVGASVCAFYGSTSAAVALGL